MNTLMRSMQYAFGLVILLVPLLGCGTTSKNLIFFTNTSIGVDVGSDPTSGTPVKAVIGYKRQEGVLNPVYDESERVQDRDDQGKLISTTSKGKLRDQAYSVIAKYQGSAEASANVDMSSAQWFATGLAAEKLADAPGIAGAVTGSAKVAEAAAKERAGIFGEQKLTHITQLESFKAVMQVLTDLKGDDHARDLVSRVAGFASRYSTTRVPTISSEARLAGNYQLVAADSDVGAVGWELVTTYLSILDSSKAKIEDAIKASDVGVLGTDAKLEEDELALRDVLVAEIAKVRRELSESVDFADAVHYFCKRIGGGS